MARPRIASGPHEADSFHGTTCRFASAGRRRPLGWRFASPLASRPVPFALPPCLAFVALLVLLFGTGLSPARADEKVSGEEATLDWSGRWDTVWASGAVRLELEQAGRAVTGTYEPGGGHVDAWLDGTLLRGRWSQAGASGQLVFAMAPDGRTFTGRYDGSRYWNGERVPPNAPGTIGYGSSATPRATLASVLDGINAAAAGDLGATFLWDQLLDYGDTSTDARSRAARRGTLREIIDLSTFRLADVPSPPDAGAGDVVRFPVGPAGQRERYLLEFARTPDGRWRLVVEPRAELAAARGRFLDALGTESHEAWRLQSRQSPRGTLRRFVEGSADPATFAVDDVIDTLDLGFLPSSLRRLEAPLFVDYLRHVLARTGGIVWQEVPDDPARVASYVHYRHPLGRIAIEPGMLEGGERVWRFGEDTLRRVDELHDALQALPSDGSETPLVALSEFFVLRERAANLSPRLLARRGGLETWQWLAVVVVPLVAFGVALVLTALATRLLRRTPDPAADAETEAFAVERERRAFARLRTAIALAVVGGAAFAAAARLGLPDEVAGGVGQAGAVAAVVGLGLVALVIVGIAARRLARRAAATKSVVDEIVYSLVGGLVRLVVVLLTFLAIADIAGLPYEGVIAGLGVGGIAIAIAARETVSNFIGAATLLADRPFKRGDVVETGDGTKARVLDVGLRSTKLRRHDDAVMMVPNALLANEVITNRGVRVRRQIFLTIGLTYDTPREKLDAFVENLRATWLRQERADPTDHYIGLKDFGASSIDIRFWGYARVRNRAEQFVAEHAFVGDIVDCARDTGVEFAFPTRTLHVVGEASSDALDESTGERTRDRTDEVVDATEPRMT